MAMYMDVKEVQRKIYKKRRGFDENNFKSLYRFTEQNVLWLSDYFLGEEKGETRGGALTNFQKMRTFLRYVGDPDGFQVGVGEDLGIHQTTANKTIWMVCKRIVSKASEWICFPTSESEMNESKNVWQIRNRIPNVIGALDCTHICIVRPHDNPDDFVNRKGLTSFNVQATCDGQGRFTSVDCSWPGSVHDARVWRNSSVSKVLCENSSGAILLADDGYGIAPWLMTPYRNPVAPHEKMFNKIHAKERDVIESAFGQLKKRFPFLQSKVRMATCRVPSAVVACFVLHNIAIHLKDDDSWCSDELQNDQHFFPAVETGSSTVKTRGEQLRDTIAIVMLEAKKKKIK